MVEPELAGRSSKRSYSLAWFLHKRHSFILFVTASLNIIQVFVSSDFS
jgi:hypothetical protein